MMLPKRSHSILIFAQFDWQGRVGRISVFKIVPTELFLLSPERVEWVHLIAIWICPNPEHSAGNTTSQSLRAPKIEN